MERSTLPKSILNKREQVNDESLNNFEYSEEDNTLVVYDEDDQEEIKFGIYSGFDRDIMEDGEISGI